MTFNKKSIKKLPFEFSLSLLTLSASLILGFLSFGGMYALWPVFPIAVGAFVLSVAYEGEIYKQNLRGALNKLFKHRFLDRQVANQFLLDHFPDIKNEACPEFFKDYKTQLKLQHQFSHKRLDAASRKRKKHVEKTLKDMEKWFAAQFFCEKTAANATEYEKTLHSWLHEHPQRGGYLQRRMILKGAWLFSSATGLLMTMGSTFLLVEAFTAIPLLASIPFGLLPVIILPMAALSGLAYGLLTYNAVTDMIANATLQKWARTLYTDFKENGLGIRNAAMTGLALFLVALAITLTVCTAGTWWTIAKHTRPLFPWLKNIPPLVMALIGADGIFFNLVNTKASWDMIYDATYPGKEPALAAFTLDDMQSLKDALSSWPKMDGKLQSLSKRITASNDADKHYKHLLFSASDAKRIAAVLRKTNNNHLIDKLPKHEHKGIFQRLKAFGKAVHAKENILQMLNPFRLFLVAAIVPIRLVLFLGHLISMGAGDDRVPGLPAVVGAGLSTVSEIFEDLHYFFDLVPLGHHHHHGHSINDLLKERHSGHNHSHDNDLPTSFVNLLFSPVYGLAALWDVGFSRLNGSSRPTLGLVRAWEKQHGIAPKQSVSFRADGNKTGTSDEWKREHILYRIERHKQKQLTGVWFGKTIAKQKCQQLEALQNDLREAQMNGEGIVQRLQNEDCRLYSKHRFFASSGKTSTEHFISHLPSRIASPAA